MSQRSFPPGKGLRPNFDWVERRACVRYPCNLETFCHMPTAMGEELAWQARVRDISTDGIGIGLILGRWFEPGTILEVVLDHPSQRHPDTHLIRVIHATVQPGGTWHIGCKFINKLNDEQLKALL